ncbi:hypothetical protein IT575_08700 [bacterium]|nr:hypothetical protein [bacterium]
MQSWEYRTFRLRQWLLTDEKFVQETAALMTELNALGAEGWEVFDTHPLVSMQYVDYILWLKRRGSGI